MYFLKIKMSHTFISFILKVSKLSISSPNLIFSAKFLSQTNPIMYLLSKIVVINLGSLFRSIILSLASK